MTAAEHHRTQARPEVHAWVDESMQAETLRSPAMYILAATYADPTTCGPTRTAMRDLLLGKVPRLHWHAEDQARQRKISATIAGCETLCTVVIATPLDPKKQERARRKCMERLFYELDQLGVTQVLLETRTESLNKRDRQMIAALRGSGVLPRHMRVDFELPSVEPMLWVADAVAGAVGLARKAVDNSHLLTLGALVEQIEISL